MPLVENGAYLDRLLMFKGTIRPPISPVRNRARRPEAVDPGTTGWGWRRSGAANRARALDCSGARRATPAWSSFATIARRSNWPAPARRRRSSRARGRRCRRGSWPGTCTTSTGHVAVHRDPAPSILVGAPRPDRRLPTPSRAPSRIRLWCRAGKPADARLWLGDLDVRERACPYGTAAWFFDRDVAAGGAPQQGPVTFVLRRPTTGWRISHAHLRQRPAGRRTVTRHPRGAVVQVAPAAPALYH